MKNRIEIKKEAKKFVKENFMTLLVPTLILIIVNTLITEPWDFFTEKTLNESIQPGLSFGTFLSVFIVPPIILGYYMFIRKVKEGAGEFGDFLNGYRRFLDIVIFSFLSGLITVIGFVLFIVPGVIAATALSMGYMLIMDDENMSGFEAIKESFRFTKGYRMLIFSTFMSFIGWFFLYVPTLGLISLYVEPYLRTTVLDLYEEIKEDRQRLHYEDI